MRWAKSARPAVEPLIAALKDSDKYVRYAAVDALDKLGWRPGQDETSAVYWVTKREWDKCIEIGAPAVEPLIAALKDSDKGVRHAAAHTLDKLGWRPGQDETSAVYWVAKREWDKCIEIGAPAVEPLIAALKDSDKYVRYAKEAADALGKLGDARAVEPLIDALRDSDVDIQTSAAKALGLLGDVRAIEPLRAALLERKTKTEDFSDAKPEYHYSEIHDVDYSYQWKEVHYVTLDISGPLRKAAAEALKKIQISR